MASPSPDRVARLRSTAGEFLSSADPPASIWLSLLGMLSSLSHLVPGGRLRMRSLQLCLHQSWDGVDQSIRIPWSQDCLRDLRWWLHLPRLSQGVSLSQVSPDLYFCSDTLDVGWGGHLAPLRHRLFVSPRRPSRALSKNAISFFLRDVITAAGASRPEVGRFRAHDVRSVSTSVAFHRNWSASAVLESATWSSSTVFSSFYLRDLQHEYDGLLSLGPLVAADSRIG